MFEDIFYRKKLNTDKLICYGFEAKEKGWIYDTNIMNNTFKLHISIPENGNVSTDLIENETNEPYILYKTNASGAFIGEVRFEIEKILRKIADECFDFSVFNTDQALKIIDYVRYTYGDEPEFLWPKLSDNAVWRRKGSNKWYGIIMKVSRSKLGSNSDEMSEIIDLHAAKDQLPGMLDNKRYFPGWHMNKKSWYTIILDNSVSTDEICYRIDESYKLAKI